MSIPESCFTSTFDSNCKLTIKCATLFDIDRLGAGCRGITLADAGSKLRRSAETVLIGFTGDFLDTFV
jgi:hypothetical protein